MRNGAIWCRAAARTLRGRRYAGHTASGQCLAARYDPATPGSADSFPEDALFELLVLDGINFRPSGRNGGAGQAPTGAPPGVH